MLVSLKIHSGAFRWNVEGLFPLEGFGESEETNYISILSNVGTCSLAEIKKLAEKLVRSD